MFRHSSNPVLHNFTHLPGGQLCISGLNVAAALEAPSLAAFGVLTAVDLEPLSLSAGVPPPLSLTNVSLLVDCGTVVLYQAFFCSLNTSFLAGAVEVRRAACLSVGLGRSTLCHE